MTADNATVARVSPTKPGTSGSTPLSATPLMLEWRPEPKKYQRCGRVNIRPLVLGPEYGAFYAAHNYYANKLKADFSKMLQEYLEDGFVVSRPHLFAMAKPIEHGGRRGWFIEFATGRILELLTCLPFALDFIAFVRDGDKDLRVIEWNYFINKAVKLNLKKAVT